MGFSLQAFFNECLGIIDGDGVPGEKWAKLKAAVQEGAKYAEECGNIMLCEDRKSS